MKKLSKKKGLTLIEIIISLAILSIIVIPLGNLALTSVKMEKDSEVKLRANTVAQQIIEYIKEESLSRSDIDTALKGGSLSLSELSDEAIKNILVDNSAGEVKDDYLFYKGENDDTYIRVGISPVNYKAEEVVPENDKTSIWEDASFQYMIKLAKDSSGNLNLYDVSGAKGVFKKDLNSTAASTILNITGKESELSYNIYQDGVNEFDDTLHSIVGSIQDFNLQIESGCPNITVNVENADENRTIRLFIDELVGEEPYVANYKVFSKGKVGVYTKSNKDNESFSGVKKVYKVEVEIYTYKNGIKTLLQNLTDYKYVKVN